MQSIELIGNIGGNVEVATIGERQYVRFSVCDNERQKDGTKIAIWYKCLYGNTKVAQYLTKGAKVYVRGRLNVSLYQQKDSGAWAIDRGVWVNELELCSSQQPQGQPTAAPQPQPMPAYQQWQQPQAQAAPQMQRAPQQQATAVQEDLPF